MARKAIGRTGQPVDKKRFPSIDVFLHRPLLCEPPLCTLKELQDGTYSIDDILVINEILDLKIELIEKRKK